MSGKRISKPGVTVATMSAESASARVVGDRGAFAQLLGERLRRLAASIPEEHRAAAGEERPRDGTPVHAPADHGGRRNGRPGESLGGEHGGRAGAQRGDRARVEECAELARGRVREEDDAGDGRQPRSGFRGKDVTHLSTV